MDVWKDARELGKAAGESACALAQGTALADVSNDAAVRLAGRELDDLDLPDAHAITQDNLNVVLDAGWISQADLCQGVKPGTVDGVRLAERRLNEARKREAPASPGSRCEAGALWHRIRSGG